MRPRRFYDLPTGYGAMTLSLLGGSKVRPAVGYMGGKWALAPEIHELQGLSPGHGADEVFLCDAGCPGWVWPELLTIERAAKVAEHLWRWRREGPVELWERLVKLPPAEDPSERAAQVLWLQGRTASSTPLLWSVERQRWEMPTGARGGRRRGETFAVSQKALVSRGTWRGGHSAGLQSTVSVAQRIERIAAVLSRQRVTFHHGDIFDVLPTDPGPGDVIYWDPDYRDCTSYGFTVDQDRMLAWCAGATRAGAQVTISEARPLALPGAHHVEITKPGGKSEWLTMSHPPQRRQQHLFVTQANV